MIFAGPSQGSAVGDKQAEPTGRRQMAAEDRSGAVKPEHTDVVRRLREPASLWGWRLGGQSSHGQSRIRKRSKVRQMSQKTLFPPTVWVTVLFKALLSPESEPSSSHLIRQPNNCFYFWYNSPKTGPIWLPGSWRRPIKYKAKLRKH